MWVKRSKIAENGGLPLFIKKFGLKKELGRAELAITATGIFSVKINGKVIPDLFMPGWTNYKKYINLCVYDITDYLAASNEIEVTVADGWYKGRLGCCKKINFYGKDLRLFAEIKLCYKDGETQTIETDENWITGVSDVVSADFFDGETIDARRLKNSEKIGHKAVKTKFSAKLEKYSYEAVRVKETILPKVIFDNGETIRYDFGKNFAGNIRFKACGKEGDTIIMKYAEVLNPDGSLYTENLRSAKSTDQLILSDGEYTFDPRFTYHGFRFAEITKSKTATISDLKGLVVTQDIDYYGDFECSDKVINGVYAMVKNGQKSNFVGIPTDCPQRDERLGWTGDAQVFCNTAMFNADCDKFLRNYLKLIRTDIPADGRIPSFAPLHFPVSHISTGVPGWAESIAVIPYFHYLHYRDKDVIKENIGAAEGWVRYYIEHSENYVVNVHNQFGDWLSVDNTTDKKVINQCLFGYSALLLSKMYKITGDEVNERKYAQVYQNAKEAFVRRYYKNGIVQSDTQTAYALAYTVGFLSVEETKKRLPELIRTRGCLTTGFIGVRFILPTLCDIGETDLAYELMARTDYPSWGYMLANGATTVWERWNGYTEENGFEDPGMNSFNHYSLGSCVEWLYSYVLGIKLSEDSQTVIIRPSISDKISYAKGRTRVCGGMISVSWQRNEKAVTLEVKADKGVKYSVDTDKFKILSCEKIDNDTKLIIG